MWSCINFLSLTVKERFRKVSAKGLCFLCLEGGHRSNSCSRKTLCKHCRGRHHHLLHTDQPPPNRTHPDKTGATEGPSASQEDASKNASKNVTANSVGTDDIGKVIIQTVPAVLRDSNGNSKVVRCFLDSGSQTSFIKQRVIEELCLDGPSVKISVSGFGGKQDKACLRKRISCTLATVDRPRCSREFEALTTAEICHPADAVEVNQANWVHLKDVNFPEDTGKFTSFWKVYIFQVYPICWIDLDCISWMTYLCSGECFKLS